MAQDSEKRFHEIMDKLLSSSTSLAASKTTPFSPSSSSSSPGEQQQSRGKKHPNASSALALVEPKTGVDVVDKCQHSSASAGSSQAPLCRPWDRGDLMRRMATFKSMTWFAKPQVISAANCARRGWINVDMDTITCESCGARLLFSTPSSWPQQQVEKAALAFSLKLDNGHKLLCPWIDNSCDETLAEFPPMTPQDLVDRFRERSSALLLLLALPLISHSALEFMRSPELEEFLKQPIMQENSNITAEFSHPKSLGNEFDANSAQLYYQAQKFISLCGWEPRSLPYIVDCKENPRQFVRDTDIISLSQEAPNKKHLSFSAQSAGSNEIFEGGENSGAYAGSQSDLKSVVLDCKLCGASAGLWVFSSVPRPLELYRVVGDTELSTEKNSGSHDPSTNVCRDIGAVFSASNLNLTIAGGPPATKQNFKATISLPIVGRNLRARFMSDNRDRMYSELNKFTSSSEEVPQSEHMVLLENGSNDQRHCSSIGDQQHEIAENGETLVEENNNHSSPGAANVTEQRRLESGRNDAGAQEIIRRESNDREAAIDRSKGPLNNEAKGSTAVKDSKQSPSSKEMEFDPIRQHRHFCPWIASTGRREPGWRQTLSALLRQKDPSRTSPSSTSLIKVDDPITSVRNLFMSPSAKRMKPSKG